MNLKKMSKMRELVRIERERWFESLKPRFRDELGLTDEKISVLKDILESG